MCRSPGRSRFASRTKLTCELTQQLCRWLVRQESDREESDCGGWLLKGVLYRAGGKKSKASHIKMAFYTGSCHFKLRHLKHVRKESEILCATGRVAKINKMVVVFVAHVPPSIIAAELEALKAVEVGLARQTFKDPIIVVNGDFNHRDGGGGAKYVADFKEIASGPTRGTNTIDIIYTIVDSYVNKGETSARVVELILTTAACILKTSSCPSGTSNGWQTCEERGIRAESKPLQLTSRDGTGLGLEVMSMPWPLDSQKLLGHSRRSNSSLRESAS